MKERPRPFMACMLGFSAWKQLVRSLCHSDQSMLKLQIVVQDAAENGCTNPVTVP